MTDIPTDYPRPDEPSPAGACVLEPIGSETEAAVRALAREHRASLYIVGLAAFATVLGDWSGQRDVAIGAAFAGRTSRDTENTIGCFVNTVPVRVRTSPGQSFDELLAQVRQASLFAAAHQDVPLECVVDRLRLPRTMAYTPLVQIAFGVQNVARSSHQDSTLRLSAAEFEPDRARLDLTVWLEERPEGLRALWTYRTELFRRATIESLHRRFVATLQAATSRGGSQWSTTLSRRA